MDGSPPTTRFSTALVTDGWMKRVVSPAPIENRCQLMIAPAELVMLRTLPCWEAVADPLTTCMPVGLAKAGAAA